MDHPAALHRLTIGVPATVEHSSEASEAGAEMGKWVAETTQVSWSPRVYLSKADMIRSLRLRLSGTQLRAVATCLLSVIVHD
jgi:hypothetical protein